MIGAGASREAGLPVAKDLADSISAKLNFPIQNNGIRFDLGDQDILDYFQHRASTREEMQPFFDATRLVRGGIVYSNSIDAFIDAHRDNPLVGLCGKLGIAKTILEAERHSKLFIDRGRTEFADLSGLRETWYVAFARHLYDGVALKEVDQVFERVSFIVFNYDRCIEHFLYHSLQSHYGIDATRAAAVMSKLSIVHPYGTISALPWQSQNAGIPFGFTANRETLNISLSKLKTYTEKISDDTETKKNKRSGTECKDFSISRFLISSRQHESSHTRRTMCHRECIRNCIWDCKRRLG